MSLMNYTAELTKFLARPLSIYVVATGAGAGIQKDLWEIPGCSAFLTGAEFPYTTRESTKFAGTFPKQFASDDFAYDLAAAAYKRAIDLEHPEREPVGLALTASVSGLTIHRGDHRVHLVCMTRDRILGSTMTLAKGGTSSEDRKLDGSLVDNHGIEALIAALNPGHPLNAPFRNVEAEARKRFFENPFFWNWPECRSGLNQLKKDVPLFPGAFDPPHEAHTSIPQVVKDRWGIAPVFTICANPPHKAAITVQEMLRRAKMLDHGKVLFTENDPLFLDKARAHPGNPLVIGADALLRMLDPKWGVNIIDMLNEYHQLGTLFFVFGREVDGAYLSGEDAIQKVPYGHRHLFRPLSGRWDVSSTAIRQASQSGDHTQSIGADPTHSSALPVA